ncbi:MAG: alpha/beta hydrolase [Planctomycetes bacterium]|nr:alpha/beta hydrolase [Planctomycetota bacterium]
MADEPKAGSDDTPVRETIPWQLRATFTPVLLVFMLLIGVRMLNAVSLYPGVVSDASVAPRVAKERDDVREVSFEAEDGVKLYGWVLGPDTAPRKIIQFMGNGEFVGHSAGLYADTCKALDAQFLLFDYRGFANSEGRPSEPGLYADARGAWRFAMDELHWKPAQTIIWGRSLGGAPAIKLTAELVADKTPPEALIIEAAFTSVRDMAGVAMPKLGKPEWLIYDLYDNLGRAPELKLPVFHFHGTSDEIIPYSQGEELYEALPGPKEHMALDGVGHNNIWDDDARASTIRQRMDAFLKAHE